jgi:hypothetical protein
VTEYGVEITHFCVICPTFAEVMVELAWYLEFEESRVNDVQSPPPEDVTVTADMPELVEWSKSPE